MAELDSLTIKISADTSDADQKIGSLASSIKRITEQTASLNGAISSLKGFTNALKNISATNLEKAGKSLVNIADCLNLFSTAKIDTEKAKQAAQMVDALKGMSLKGLPNGDSLFTKVSGIKRAVEELSMVSSSSLVSAIEGIKDLKTAVDMIKGIDASGVQLVVRSVEMLTTAVNAISTIQTPDEDKMLDIIGLFGTLRTMFDSMNVDMGGFDVATLAAQMDTLREVVANISAMAIHASSLNADSSANIAVAIQMVRNIAEAVNGLSGLVFDPTACEVIDDVALLTERINKMSKLGSGMKPSDMSNIVGTVRELGTVLEELALVPMNDNTDQLTAMIDKISGFVRAVSKMDGTTGRQMDGVVKAVEDLGNLHIEGGLDAGELDTITALVDKVAAFTRAAANLNTNGLDNIDSVVRAMSELSSIQIAGGESGIAQSNAFTALISSVGGFARAVGKLNEDSLYNIEGIMDAVGRLSGMNVGGDAAGLTALVSSVSGLARVGSKLDDDSITRILEITDALQRLAAVAATMGNDFIVQIGVKGGDRVRDMANDAAASSFAMRTLRDSANMVKSVFSGFGKVGQFAVSAFRKVGDAVKGTGKAFASSFKSISRLFQLFTRRALSMAIRGIIKDISSGFKDGLDALVAVSSEAAATMNSLSASMGGLKASMGSALYSFISMVSGALQTLIYMATAAMNALSALFSALGGGTTYMKGLSKATKGYGSSAGGAGKAAKKLKEQLMSFDEINKLNADNSGGGGGGGGGGGASGVGSFIKTEIPQMLRDAVARANFTEIGRYLGVKLNAALSTVPWKTLQRQAGRYADMLTTFINGFIGEVKPNVIGDSIAGLLTTAMTFINKFWYDTDWNAIGTKLAKALGRAINGINAQDVGKFLVRKIQAAFRFLSGFLGNINWADVTAFLKGVLEGAANGLTTGDLEGFVQSVCDAIKGALGTLRELLGSEEFASVKRKVVAGLRVLLSNLPFIAGQFIGVAASLVGALAKDIIDYFRNHSIEKIWSDVKGAITEFMKGLEIDGAFTLTGIKVLGVGAAVAVAISVLKQLLTAAMFRAGFSGNLGSGILRGAAFTAGIGIGISLITDIVATLDGENKVTMGEITDWVTRAMTSLGLILIAGGAYAPGALVFGLGVTLQLTYTFVNATTSAATNALEVGIGSVVDYITDNAANVSLSAENLEKLGKSIELFESEINGNNPNIGQFVGMLVKISGYGDVFTFLEELGTPNFDTQNYALMAAVLEHFGVSLEDIYDDLNGKNISPDALNALKQYWDVVSEMKGGADMGEVAKAIENINRAIGNGGNSKLGAFLDYIAGGSWGDNLSTLATIMHTLGINVDDLGKKSGLTEEQLAALQTAIDTLNGTSIEVNADTDEAAEVGKTLNDASKKITSFKNAYERRQTNGGKATMFGAAKKEAEDAVIQFNAANDAVDEVIETIKIIPSSTDIYINLMNKDSLLKSLNSVKSAIASVKSKNVSIKVDAHLSSGAKNFLKQLTKITDGSTITTPTINAILNANAYAKGGYPSKGDLFIANERGAEMVGSIGGKSAVANQNEIGDAIFKYMDAHDRQSGMASEGVNEAALASAIVSALKSAGMGAVYLDGRQLAQSINRETQRSGRPAISF